MPTNHLGQRTTDSGHVITESERIAEALRTVAPGLTAKHYAKITNYVLDYAHTDWSKNVNMGIALGHKDAAAMLQSVLKPSTIDVPASEIRKIISALTTEATQAGKGEQ